MAHHQIFEIVGPIERFNGHVWEDVLMEVPIEVSPIGEHQVWTHALLVGDVPIRYLTDNPNIRILTTEATAL